MSIIALLIPSPLQKSKKSKNIKHDLGGDLLIKRTDLPTPTFEHSPDCTCCDFGHLRFFYLQFGLKKCESTVIGVRGQFKGISGGEMRRLSFVSEVLSDPALLLCDEPTTGLDSWMAENVVGQMRYTYCKG
jgi:hypothetical protein